MDIVRLLFAFAAYAVLFAAAVKVSEWAQAKRDARRGYPEPLRERKARKFLMTWGTVTVGVAQYAAGIASMAAGVGALYLLTIDTLTLDNALWLGFVAVLGGAIYRGAERTIAAADLESKPLGREQSF